MSAAPVLALVPKRPRLVDYLDDVESILDTLDGLEDGDDEARDALSAMLIDKIAGTRAKTDSTARVLASLEAAEAAALAERARLDTRAKYFARQQQRLTDYLLAVLDASKLDKLDGDVSTLARRRNPARVVIDSEAEIPWEYMRLPDPPPVPDAVPDKAALKQALKDGPVNGCRLLQSYRLVRS